MLLLLNLLTLLGRLSFFSLNTSPPSSPEHTTIWLAELSKYHWHQTIHVADFTEYLKKGGWSCSSAEQMSNVPFLNCSFATATPEKTFLACSLQRAQQLPYCSTSFSLFSCCLLPGPPRCSNNSYLIYVR